MLEQTVLDLVDLTQQDRFYNGDEACGFFYLRYVS